MRGALRNWISRPPQRRAARASEREWTYYFTSGRPVVVVVGPTMAPPGCVRIEQSMSIELESPREATFSLHRLLAGRLSSRRQRQLQSQLQLLCASGTIRPPQAEAIEHNGLADKLISSPARQPASQPPNLRASASAAAVIHAAGQRRAGSTFSLVFVALFV